MAHMPQLNRNVDPLTYAEGMKKPMNQYLMKFTGDAPHLEYAGVLAHRDYVLRNGPFINVPDLAKNNKRAAEVREAGNWYYLRANHKEALQKYNESICWAKTGSEDLAIGYANRSAIYYDQGEYEIALTNINLAKQHNYPDRLMSKVLARELNCKQKIHQGQSKCTISYPRLTMNVAGSTKIPFLSRDVSVHQLPDYGRSMIADRDFKAGDMILHEKPMMACLYPETKYMNCDHCSIRNFHSLIPCPNCVSVMYCDEECLKKGLKFYHRFECGISEKLHHIATGRAYIGARMFFYGLGLFEDNLKEMMQYCVLNTGTGADPSTLDYAQYDQMEEFKVFHNAKPPIDIVDNHRYFAAVYYSVYLQHPLVKSMFTTETQRKFLLRYLHQYMLTAFQHAIGFREEFTCQLYSIASVLNHSCDPNVLTGYNSGQLKVIVLRPIAKGEQICNSYGPLYGELSEADRKTWLCNFDCLCVACDRTKRRKWLAKALPAPSIPNQHVNLLVKLLQDVNINMAAKLNALQQFIERYAATHPRREYLMVLKMYQVTLMRVLEDEAECEGRTKFAIRSTK